MMTSRERDTAALDFKRPDHLPVADALWDEKIGGWVLIGGYLLWSITPILYSVTNLSLGFYYDYILAGASLPYLFAGVLFIIYAFRKTKKTA